MFATGTAKRAQGCLLGQLTGDSLGSLVEFESPAAIARRYPGGVREMEHGGTWNTLPGQPTDDSEMALILARTLVKEKTYRAASAWNAYRFWLDSGPFDYGNTIRGALRGNPNHRSQANGALMRISPLGIFGASHSDAQVAEWAEADARLTHPHPVCLQANALYTVAIARAVRSAMSPAEVYASIAAEAKAMAVERSLAESIEAAATRKPYSYTENQGWVLVALQNALWQLLHAPDFESGIVDTVMQGGDTDTNAAICGSLLGAVHGLDAVPSRWVNAVLQCRPLAGDPNAHRPRPECFWPVDALALAKKLGG